MCFEGGASVEQWGTGVAGGEGAARLVFRQIDQNDFGRYLCTVSNSLGEASKTFTLTGEAPSVGLVGKNYEFIHPRHRSVVSEFNY